MALINDRFKNFDFLRGIAILGVIFVHVSQSFSTNILAVDFLESLGRFGVQIFFFVSSLTMMHMSYIICIVLDFKELNHGPLFLLIIICLYYGIAFCLKLSLYGKFVNYISLIGEYTYPMYLIHFLIISVLAKTLVSLDFDDYSLSVNLLAFIIVSYMSFVLSIFIDKYIDSSLRKRLKKYLLIKIGGS